MRSTAPFLLLALSCFVATGCKAIDQAVNDMRDGIDRLAKKPDAPTSNEPTSPTSETAADRPVTDAPVASEAPGSSEAPVASDTPATSTEPAEKTPTQPAPSVRKPAGNGYFERLDDIAANAKGSGELTRFEPPPGSNFGPIVTRTYDGLVIAGELRGGGMLPDDMIEHSDVLPIEQIAALSLTLLGLMAEHVSPENMAVDRAGGPPYKARMLRDTYLVDRAYSPRLHTETLEHNLVTPERYMELFSRQHTGRKARVGLPGGRAWGGGQEFPAQRAYQSFLKEDLSVLVDWAKTMPTDVALLSNIPLRGQFTFDNPSSELQYDMATKSFELSYTPVRQHRLLYRPTRDDPFIPERLEERRANFKLILEPDRAEEMLERTSLYAVAKAKFYGVEATSRSMESVVARCSTTSRARSSSSTSTRL